MRSGSITKNSERLLLGHKMPQGKVFILCSSLPRDWTSGTNAHLGQRRSEVAQRGMKLQGKACGYHSAQRTGLLKPGKEPGRPALHVSLCKGERDGHGIACNISAKCSLGLSNMEVTTLQLLTEWRRCFFAQSFVFVFSLVLPLWTKLCLKRKSMFSGTYNVFFLF